MTKRNQQSTTKIAVIGVGYVGLVSGTCMADLGHDVTCINRTPDKVIQLQKGIVPIYEPGLKKLVLKNMKAGRLRFTTDLDEGIKDAKIIFITVGTPSMSDGQADISQVKIVAKEIGKRLQDYTVIVDKSTVPIGTAEVVRGIVKKYYRGKFDVVSCPEFLREGYAIYDFKQGDRIVIGADNQRAADVMLKLFKNLKMAKLVTSIPSAEMIKYASNSFLATKISFINEIANICELVGADVKEVAAGMGMDKRIGDKFLQAGIGYGGSCFPKDVRALENISVNKGYYFRLLKAVNDVNNYQRQIPVMKLLKLIKNLNGKGKLVTVLGLAFKNNTDDIRESSAISIIKNLLLRGARVNAYDPVAENNATKILGKKIQYFADPYKAVKGAQAVIVATEWEEFTKFDWKKIKKLMKKPILIDGKNLLDPAEMRKIGFHYEGIGRL
ncbi:MAG: UDP-glucose/GDP-mannose dehydrogenase family protein [Patescibacteria group bacterium]